MAEIVTTALEVLGLLLVAAGAAAVCAPLSIALALAVAGAVLIGESALIAWVRG